ncbi:MAG: response regulator receiver protein [Firmicutes bacterium]|nr:response regulator receiver protein [Bacillota bacterium]
MNRKVNLRQMGVRRGCYMIVNVVCSVELQAVLTELVKARGIEVNSEAKVTLVEKGCDYSPHGVAIVFEYNSLPEIVELLDLMAKKHEPAKNIISARRLDSDNYEILAYEDIIYFEAAGNNVYCLTATAKYRIKNKLYELETNLREQGFIRVGKSVLLNIMSVVEIIPWFGSRLLLKLKNNHELEVTRNYVKSFKEFLEL